MQIPRIGVRPMAGLAMALFLSAPGALGLATARADDDESVPAIRLNSIGYLPDRPKQASIAAKCRRFAVVRLRDGAKVLEAAVAGPVEDVDTRTMLDTADFSTLTEPGEYRLDVPGVGRSDVFRVGADIYREPFLVVTRAMSLWRCGTAVRGEYRGDVFAHAACHTEDAWLDFVTGKHQRADGTGGWHDAGDYNKYVVNAGITVGVMFRAWEDFQPTLRQVRLEIPESGNTTPDFLDELRWELEWLLKMQAPDGSAYHKLTTRMFGAFVLPEMEKSERYFTPWGSAATADLMAMTAQAARHFRPFDPAFADRCLAAASKARTFLEAHPKNHAADQKGFFTGGYETGDADDRLWAAAEYWETTGDADALRDLEARIRAVGSGVDADFDWGEVKNLGLFTYLASKRPGRDQPLVDQVKQSLIAAADSIVADGRAKENGYRRPLGSRYYWGCNGSTARQVLVLRAAHRVEPKPAYLNTSLDALNYLFGRNPYGRSFVTGLGARPPLHPHDRRSGGDDVKPWPGYLVGGAHPLATSWKDEQPSFQTNEIAINWNAALIYALAAAQDAKAP
ncbi:MAG: glycoside hydrolase family 9 protein [Isosphaeraceae bacterium]